MTDDTTTPEPTPTEAPVAEEPSYGKDFDAASPYNDDIKDGGKYRAIRVGTSKMTSDGVVDAIKVIAEKLMDTLPEAEAGKTLELIARSMSEVEYTHFLDGRFEKTLERLGSDWVQRVEGENGRPIGLSVPGIKIGDDGDRLSGINAVRYITRTSGVGSTVRVPCWHSGLVLTLEPFREKTILDLAIALSSDQVELGGRTIGSSFNGDDVYVLDTILQYLTPNIIDSNVKDMPLNEVIGHMLMTDIPLLLCGALGTIYPSGYPVAMACRHVDDVEDPCNHLMETKLDDNGSPDPDTLINFKRMVWVDRTRLSKGQRHHMSATSPIHSLEAVKNYQRELRERIETTPLEISNEGGHVIEVRFKTPTVGEYLTESNRWVSDVTSMVDDASVLNKALTRKAQQKERTSNLNRYSKTLGMTKSLPWVDLISITITQGDDEPVHKVIDDRDDIRKSLEALASKQELTGSFLRAVISYQEDVTIALAGVPNYTCPSCGRDQAVEGAKEPLLVPVNMVGYFFTITEWRNIYLLLSHL